MPVNWRRDQPRGRGPHVLTAWSRHRRPTHTAQARLPDDPGPAPASGRPGRGLTCWVVTYVLPKPVVALRYLLSGSSDSGLWRKSHTWKGSGQPWRPGQEAVGLAAAFETADSTKRHSPSRVHRLCSRSPNSSSRQADGLVLSCPALAPGQVQNAVHTRARPLGAALRPTRPPEAA